MIIRLFLALLALVGIMAFLGWYGKASDEDRNRAIKNILIYGIAGALLLLVITGRIPWLFAIISAALPFWRKILAARSLLGTLQSLTGRSFTATQLTTQYLRVRFDFIAKRLDADILSGEFAGKRLSDLGQSELDALLQSCADDTQSVAAIHAYIRARGFGWQSEGQGQPGDSSQAGNDQPRNGALLTRAQALEILGLDDSASERDIRRAHKRLMQKVHPDRGGSDFLAAQINAAKATLIDDA